MKYYKKFISQFKENNKMVGMLCNYKTKKVKFFLGQNEITEKKYFDLKFKNNFQYLMDDCEFKNGQYRLFLDKI
jgi:hypothetical protein